MEILSDRSGNRNANADYSRPPRSGGAAFNFHMSKQGTLKGKLGLLYAKDLYAFLSELTGRVTVSDFDQLPTPFAAMTTDLETGDSVALRNGNLASALRASMSIPGVFEPWELNGRWYVDGGLKANLPVIAAKKMFPGHPILAINLSPKNITRSRETMPLLTAIRYPWCATSLPTGLKSTAISIFISQDPLDILEYNISLNTLIFYHQ